MNPEKFDFYPFNFKDGEIIRYKNRAITKRAPSKNPFYDSYFRFWCGYTCLKKTDVPKDWWGNYKAPGLQLLKISGGITYCRQAMVPGQEEILKKFRKKIDSLNKWHEKLKNKTHEKGLKLLQGKMKLEKEYNDELSKSDEGYVVFGFDCGHHGDENDPLLKDPNHVMMLTEQMEFQLLKFKEHYYEYRDAHPSVQNIVRKTIIDNVRREADFDTTMGLGEMIHIITDSNEGL